jgi:CrcB protein
VSIGGAIGAPSRLAASILISRNLHYPPFPYPTLTVNVVGSFVLALLTWTAAGRLGVSDTTRLLIGTGAMGAFTTFSTFSLEVLLLLEQSRRMTAMLYVLLSVFLCLAAAYGGMQLGRTFDGPN